MSKRHRPSVLTDPVVNRVLYGAGIVANLVLGAFAVELAAGHVPLPDSWLWAVPIMQAAITGCMAFLPRIGAEDVAAQVDHLKAAGVPRHEMVVLSQEEAVRAMVDDPASIEDDGLVRAVADEIERRLRAEPSREA